MKSMVSWSSSEWIGLKKEHQDSSPSYDHKSDVFYCLHKNLPKAKGCILSRCGNGAANQNPPLTVDLFLNGDLTPGTKVMRKPGGKEFVVSEPLIYSLILFR